MCTTKNIERNQGILHKATHKCIRFGQEKEEAGAKRIACIMSFIEVSIENAIQSKTNCLGLLV